MKSKWKQIELQALNIVDHWEKNVENKWKIKNLKNIQKIQQGLIR